MYCPFSRDGYKKAVETVDRAAFKRVFEHRARERNDMATRVEIALDSKGAKPDTGGTAMGAFHRSLMSVASVVQNDEKAAIETIDDELPEPTQTGLEILMARQENLYG